MPALSIPFARLGTGQKVETGRPENPVSISRLTKIARCLNTHWFRCLLLLLIGILVRSPALQGQRIWDDQYLAHDNPFIKSPLLILESFRHYLFLDSFSGHYRPVQNMSFFVDYFFWNTDEFGFHLTNVVLHVGSGILLYFLLRHLLASLYLRRAQLTVRDRFLKRLPWISQSAFLIALLWTVHPVHSAAVDYISGRADSLAFLFAATGWLLFFQARRAQGFLVRISSYVLSASCGLLALLSREIAIVWIVLFLAHLLFIEKRLSLRSRMVALICCASLVMIYVGFRHLPQQRLTAAQQEGWMTIPVRAVLMVRALGDYGRLMVFPGNLHMDRSVFDPNAYRSHPNWRQAVGTEYLSILGLALLALLVFGSIRKGNLRTTRIFGASWFLAAYLPVSNIVQLNANVAEHWLYLPSVGLLIFLTGCALELPRRYGRIAIAVALLATAGLGVRSYVRSGDWANDETFYKRTIAAGGSSSRIAVNLAQVYARRGDYVAAESILRKVLKITPDYPNAQNNLGNLLLHQGKPAEAKAVFDSLVKGDAQTRKEYPRTWIAAVNLAYVYHKDKDDKSAFAVLRSARAAHPGVWELVSCESELLRETEEPDAAISLVEDFARDNWWHYGAAVALGRLYAQKGDINRAEAALRRASWLDVHDAEALRLIVLMRLRENRLQDAFQTQERAIARQPDQPSQYMLLSNILERMGRSEEARTTLAKASRLRALAGKPVAIN
jgi:tetratricopeptide (TPR) repeat protein